MANHPSSLKRCSPEKRRHAIITAVVPVLAVKKTRITVSLPRRSGMTRKLRCRQPSRAFSTAA